MKPDDIIITKLRNGIEKAWRITAILVGSENQEGVVEMQPIMGQIKHSLRTPTRCPIDILQDAIDNGNTQHFKA